ncbi:MAG TPA: NAD(P)H-dependent oxidoreductase [Geobacteraceae bacterium]|nr:NAD(P)H-dependent oxidoreductase [Geobacteraceae bacterium]
MAKLLYVTCDLRSIEQSRSLFVGSEFLNEYIKQNPKDEIHMLDLYRDHIQRVDADVMSGLWKMRHGNHFAALTEDEQRKIGRIWRLADQFIASDKCVIVTPMWNLGFPAELRMYIDTICVVNKTYRYSPRGPEGLLKNQGRKCLLIHSTDGFDSDEKEAHCVSYIRSVMKFIGIEEFEAIAIQGDDAIPEKALEFINEEVEQVLDFAARL